MHEYRPVLRPVPRFEPPARPYPSESDRAFVAPQRSRSGPCGVTDGGTTAFPAPEARGVTPAAAEPPRERGRPARTCGNKVSSDGRGGNDSVAAACSGGVPRDPRRSRVGAVPERGVPEGVRQVLRAEHTAAVADAREYSWRVLRIVLEVLDRRRPVAQLARFASPAVQAAVSTLVGGDHLRHRELGTAVLVRVHAIGIDEGAAEVCGTYQRGPRHFAIAARIIRTRTSGWRLTALRV